MVAYKEWYSFLDFEFERFLRDIISKIQEQSDGEISKGEAADILQDWLR